MENQTEKGNPFFHLERNGSEQKKVYITTLAFDNKQQQQKEFNPNK